MPMAPTTKAVEPKGVPAIEELFFSHGQVNPDTKPVAKRTMALSPHTYGQANINRSAFDSLFKVTYNGPWVVTLRCTKPLGHRANSHKIYEAVVELY